ncbi:MAG: Stp1/IreP family PP2C-type Ser/Thr phosphatase [Bacilli bacterium]|nr:Stp1/IreP family PP2C-type Ser/Thr phosphatase [Bacilli bacterium]MDD3305151.1 Stp1/IreP family PP2C-type Ser/Thr phosphatase [Bacilli bacterium]MDD4053665.1 Stp1/IreP family PP2C-type Ser/Thr phosphatase [Bacilli bacterium]MDD4411164.1 Stp1/IreP family PP2C-type Ser/Thr phosphatase [Bacilli bacterium]
MQTYYLTDAGKVREHNEDRVIIVKNDNEEYFMAVADGMGGHRAGEIASSMTIEYLRDAFLAMETIGDKANAVNFLRESVLTINKKIFAYTDEFPESKGMGTTLVVAIVTANYLLFGNIGDSSGFVMKEDKLYKVTKDHTLVNLLVSTGELTAEEAKLHPKKNVLMRALGANDPIDIDIFDVDMGVSEILLCSDGLTNMLSEEQIQKVLETQELTVEERVIRLIKKSNNRGGTDNISIAYLVRESGE